MLTDVGMRRNNNQDSCRSQLASTREDWETRGHVFIVADGMGAHAVGELASQLAVDSIPHTYHKLSELSCADAITRAFEDTNGQIHNKASANPEFKGMGTTATALVLLPEGAMIAHVGDSRAYRVRGQEIEQLSYDHSLVWEVVRRGHLTFEEAHNKYASNVITRSLGPEADVEVDIEGLHELQADDVFVLCSDGLSGPVEDFEIGLIASSLPPDAACQCLVDLANLRGGPDNVTVLCVRIPTLSADGGTSISRGSTSTASLSLAVGGAAGLLLGGAAAALQLLGIVPYIFIAVGLAALVAAWVIRRRSGPQTSSEPNSYARAECALDPRNRQHLARLLEEFRNRAKEEDWEVNWSAVAKTDGLASFARSLRAFADALRRRKEETQRLLDR